jgi:hypothetical protein
MSEGAPDRRPSDQLPERDADRNHGQFLLGVMDAEERRKRDADPLLESMRQAFEAKASEAEADQQ